MIPKLFFRRLKKTSNAEGCFVRLAVLSFVLFLLFGLMNALLFESLIGLTLLPLATTFLVLGAGLLLKVYKEKGIEQYREFDEFWKSMKFVSKVTVWYSSLFFLLWFAAMFVMMCLSILHSILFFNS